MLPIISAYHFCISLLPIISACQSHCTGLPVHLLPIISAYHCAYPFCLSFFVCPQPTFIPRNFSVFQETSQIYIHPFPFTSLCNVCILTVSQMLVSFLLLDLPGYLIILLNSLIESTSIPFQTYMLQLQITEIELHYTVYTLTNQSLDT